MSLIELAFDKETKLTGTLIRHLQRMNGLKTAVYFPQENPSLYNDSSQDYTYNTSSDVDGDFLFTGIYDAEPLTALESEFYSSFSEGDSKMWVTDTEKLEIQRNSKVETWFRGSMKIFRVQNLDIVNGNDGKPMYGVFDLVPII